MTTDKGSFKSDEIEALVELRTQQTPTGKDGTEQGPTGRCSLTSRILGWYRTRGRCFYVIIIVFIIGSCCIILLPVLFGKPHKATTQPNAKKSESQSQESLSQSRTTDESCPDSATVIDPVQNTCDNGIACFKCEEEIPSAGRRDTTGEFSCPFDYNITDDGDLVYNNQKYNRSEVSNWDKAPPKGLPKTYISNCCMLKQMISKQKQCPKDHVYKCFLPSSSPDCFCENGTICEGNGTQMIECRCFWSPCKFANHQNLENCWSKKKEPDFKNCQMEYKTFKCYCYGPTGADLRSCSEMHSNKSDWYKLHEEKSGAAMTRSPYFTRIFYFVAVTWTLYPTVVMLQQR